MTRSPSKAKVRERLHSWKEIADYLGRGVRTVQRWERDEGLPVHRMAHQKAATVLAVTAELDAWLEQRAGMLDKPEPYEEQRSSRKTAPWLAAAGLTVLAGAGWWLFRTGPSSEAALRVTPVTIYPGVEADPAFSPDGSRVAFTWNGEGPGNETTSLLGSESVYVKLLAVERPLRLTSGTGWNPAWSPDGKWIAFVRSGASISNQLILLVSATGGSERVVGNIVRPNVYLPKPYMTFTPDGRWLILMDASGSRLRHSALVLMSVESGEKRPLTKPPPGMNDTAPALSPDGRTLAFSRSNPGSGNIYLLALTPEFGARGEPRQLTYEKFPAGNPVWTADGREIIYGSRDNVPPGLYRAPVTGRSGRRLIPGTGMIASTLAISRQGDRLAYSNRKEDIDVWRLPLGESSSDNPASEWIASSRFERYPQYSPDGSQIAFTSNRSGTHELWVCRSDGSGAMQLSFLGSRFAAQPSWSPDGKRVAFNSDGDGAYDLYVLPAVGGRPRRLTDDPGNDQSPVWSPDGKWIYFCSERGGVFRVWKMPAEGGPAVCITRNGGPQVQLSPDGKSVYYVATWDRLGLWRASAESGQEEQIVDEILSPQSFTVGRAGVFYYRMEAGSKRLFLYRFSTNRPERVPAAPLPMQHYAPNGMSVSPNGRFLLVGIQFASREGDIMMAEYFR